MPMLAAETARTTAKPARTFARMRKVGSFSDCGQTRPDIPTLGPRIPYPSEDRTPGARSRRAKLGQNG